MDVNWFFSFGAIALIFACFIGAIQSRGLLPAMTARILLAMAWLVAVLSAAGFLAEGAPFNHRLMMAALVGLPFGVFLVLFEICMTKTVTKQQERQTEQEPEQPLDATNQLKETVANQEKPTKQSPTIICDEVGELIVNWDGFTLVPLVGNSNSNANWRLFVARFHSKPLPNVQNVDVNATITIKSNGSKDKVLIKHGVWVDKHSDEFYFKTGEFRELGLGFVEDGHFYLCEREYLEKSDRYWNVGKSCRLMQGKIFDVQVELIGKSLGDVILTQEFKFKIELKTKPLIKMV
jgi:hypothetical protein